MNHWWVIEQCSDESIELELKLQSILEFIIKLIINAYWLLLTSTPIYIRFDV